MSHGIEAEYPSLHEPKTGLPRIGLGHLVPAIGVIYFIWGIRPTSSQTQAEKEWGQRGLSVGLFAAYHLLASGIALGTWIKFLQ